MVDGIMMVAQVGMQVAGAFEAAAERQSTGSRQKTTGTLFEKTCATHQGEVGEVGMLVAWGYTGREGGRGLV